MHSTAKMYLDRLHEGQTPPSWAKGDEFFQKAKFIATVAWSFVKDPADPELPNCDLSHQENLIGETESIMSGNKPAENSRFGYKVAELIKELKPEDIKK